MHDLRVEHVKTHILLYGAYSKYMSRWIDVELFLHVST